MDEDDIQRIADEVMASTDVKNASSELRAEIGYNAAYLRAYNEGLTVKAAWEVAARVKRRIEWTIYSNRQKEGSANS